ncbi:hypothetical protein QQ045_005068 [Rhodiola kirilowii]
MVPCRSPPQAGTIKINSDGSWDAGSRKAGIGVVARDNQGLVLWAWAKWLEFRSCPNETEGFALLEGMKIAFKLGINRAIFEVDSLEVYKVVSTGYGMDDWSDSWLGAVMEMLRLRPAWSIRFASRESNHAADCIAHKARTQQWFCSGLEALPLCLLDVLYVFSLSVLVSFLCFCIVAFSILL